MPSIPALVQILIIFLAVVVAAGRKVHLGLAAALGGVALALWRGLDPLSVARSVATEALRADTLLLVVLMSWIMAFSAAMKRSGAMASLSSTLVELMPSPRVAMAVAPLLIGTLPMPGGAILSAPLVDAMDPDRTRGADVLSAANFWFRHGLELAWPLYPAFILTSSLSGVSSGRLIALNAYALPLLFLLGLVFILPAPRRGTNKAGGDATGAAPEGPARRPLAPRIRAFSAAVAPLALVLGVYVALDALWKVLAPLSSIPPAAAVLAGRYFPIYVGLAAGSLYLLRWSGGSDAFKGSLGASTLKLVLVIVGIRVFSALLGAAGVAGAAAGELAAVGIPTFAAIAALPFVAGLVTGVGFGYVGLAFPIVLGLIQSGGSIPLEAAVVLAGASGYAGMMLSPLHVCLVVSSEHFGVGLASTIRRYAAPLAIFVALAAAYAGVLSLALR